LYVVPKVALTCIVDTFLPNEKMRLIHTVRRLQTAEVALVFVVAALVCAAQTLSPGEVRLSSRPYVPQPTIRVQTGMVDLEVVVRDNHGRPVPGLTKDDFILYDSRKIRDFTSFSIESSDAAINTPVVAQRKLADSEPDTTAPPVASTSPSSIQTGSKGRSIVLLFDDINTTTGDMARAKIGAIRFIKEASAGGDRIALFTTSGSPNLNFTSDTAAILAAMTKVQSHPRISSGGLALCPRMTAYEAYQIVNNDPRVMEAKVKDACGCSGAPVCTGVNTSELLIPPPTAGGDPYGGGATLTMVVGSVRAQAEQTWGQARVASQATLDSIKAALDQLAKMPDRHMLLLASSGFLSGSLDRGTPSSTKRSELAW